jgi:hypothetical protein
LARSLKTANLPAKEVGCANRFKLCGIKRKGVEMQKGSTFLRLVVACWLVTGCSNFNENVWQSLKARDALAHPTVESPRPSDKPVSYDDYAKERKILLDGKRP